MRTRERLEKYMTIRDLKVGNCFILFIECCCMVVRASVVCGRYCVFIPDTSYPDSGFCDFCLSFETDCEIGAKCKGLSPC